MKRLLSLVFNEEEPLIHISLLFGVPAWLLVILSILGVLKHGFTLTIFSFVLAFLGTVTGFFSLFRCKRRGLACFVTGLSGLLLALLFLGAAWANSQLRDLH